MGQEGEKPFISTRNKKLLVRFLLLSLLAHFIFVIFFFHYDYHHNLLHNLAVLTHIIDTQETPVQTNKKVKSRHEQVLASLKELKKQRETNLPAKLRAPKSNFGWVIFEEPTQQIPQPLVIPTTLDGPIGQAHHAQATEGKQGPVQKKVFREQKPTLHKKTIPAPPQALKQAAAPAQLQPPLPQAVAKLAQPATVIETSPMIGEQAPTQQPAEHNIQAEDNIEDRIAHIRDLDARINAFASGSALPTTASRATETILHAPEQTAGSSNVEPTEERLIGGPGGIRVRGARSLTHKSPRNIIALTKGFIEKHHGEEGTDLIDRDGDPNKRPSFEELKYLSYESHVSWCLQAAWKQNFGRSMVTKYPSRMEAIIEFTLDEQGTLTKSELLQSTGYREIDTMIMKNTQFASPFPPLPKHFGTSNYTTGRVIHVYTGTDEY
ncbi:MAG: energy transducer TonB [Candidatus Babeliales bacterium]|jgi:TonB family protein